MLELFQHSFMVRALIAGALVGVICPALGTFLVLRRLALIADTLAHVALAGVAVGLVTGTSPFIFAIIASTLAAGAIEWLRSTGRVLGDVALALFLYAALAVAIVLISLDHGLNANLFSFLFGSILTVTTTDLWLIGGLAVVVLLTVLVFYPELLQTTFDQELATVSGLRVRWVNLLLAVLTGVTVALAIADCGCASGGRVDGHPGDCKFADQPRFPDYGGSGGRAGTGRCHHRLGSGVLPEPCGRGSYCAGGARGVVVGGGGTGGAALAGPARGVSAGGQEKAPLV